MTDSTQRIVDCLLEAERLLKATVRGYLDTQDKSKRVLVLLERDRSLWPFMVAYYVPAFHSFVFQTSMDNRASAWLEFSTRAEQYVLPAQV